MYPVLLKTNDRFAAPIVGLIVWLLIAGLAPRIVIATQEALLVDGERQFSPADIEFFETKIRPILVEHCLQCHGGVESKIRGGLRLTSRAEMIAGGDSGSSLTPGEPDNSSLIAAVRYEDFEMPPKGQLQPTEIESLVKWVEMGAPDPRLANSASVAHEIDIEAGKRFWSFAPRIEPTPPETIDGRWPRSPIDRFVLANLETHGIAPVVDADRETMIRRVYIALIGLPPTIDQIDRFISDPDDFEIALASVVDPLLASRHFGERWGRHWLDVARFAESSGGGRSLMFPEAWRYRDYVIDAFNADKPFDQFVKQQIAGDLLPFETHDQKIEQLVAAGFLALGPTNYEQQDKELLRMEVIDEQVDTIGRAFLGLTLGCARCHDHKFDPIPMTDYYALAGILGSTLSLVDGNVSSYVTQPLATERELETDKKYRDLVAKLTRQLESEKQKLVALDPEQVDPDSDSGENRTSRQLAGIVIDDRQATRVGDWMESTSLKPFVDGQYLHDQDQEKGNKQVIFTPRFESGGLYEVRMSYGASGNRASNVPVTIDHQDGQAIVIVNQSEPPPIDGLFISLGSYRFEADNQSAVTISNAGTDGHVIVDAVQFLPSEFAKGDRSKLGNSAPGPVAKRAKAETAGESPDHRIGELKRKIQSLDGELREIKRNRPPPVAVAMSVMDVTTPADGHLHIRGSVRNLGPVVKRGFLSVCSNDAAPILGDDESGRLQLAEWIASPQHPLTARVYVNRVWRHLFGRGLVRTTDNFGFVGQTPSHPELLDYLANEFIRQGWSTKKLIRQIVLSRVYRLSSVDSLAAREKDSENRWLWRSNRRRVDAEVLRDSILFVSGSLDATPGGLTIRKISQYDLGYEFETVRRSVYVPAFRNSMLDLFEAFDFANPNLVIGDRNTSTLPTQALFLMNNGMVIEQSRQAAKRLLAVPKIDDRQRIELAYRRALGRYPSDVEIDESISFLSELAMESKEASPDLVAWTSFCHVLFASLDFRYVD